MSEMNAQTKKYAKIGIIAGIVVVIALIAGILIGGRGKETSVSTALSEVSTNAVSAADLKIAVINMDKIQMDAKALQDLRKQRASYEEKLKSKMDQEQKALIKEKSDIEKNQDVLSQEALQRRVTDYQRRVGNLQRDLNERANAIDASYQSALATLQKKHLDPIIEGVIAKKNLSLVIDGRMARIGANVKELDVTDEVVNALNKKVSSVKMDKPKGF